MAYRLCDLDAYVDSRSSFLLYMDSLGWSSHARIRFCYERTSNVESDERLLMKHLLIAILGFGFIALSVHTYNGYFAFVGYCLFVVAFVGNKIRYNKENA